MTSAIFSHRPGWAVPWLLSLSFGLLPLVLTGCITPPFGLGKEAEAPKASDSMEIGPDGTTTQYREPDAKIYSELAAAKQLFEEKDLVAAEKIFHKLAKNKKNPDKVLQEARFLEAECQVLRNELSKAEGTYKLLLNEHRHCQYRAKVGQRLYDIADYWLNDTRKRMELYEQKRAGKIWYVPPSFIHWSKDKPFLDEEGRALECLKAVVEADINGPLKEKALFYLGTVYFFRADYREADHWYSLLWDDKSHLYSRGQLAQKAIKQSIICKQVVNGGSCYDRRTLEHARQLVEEARVRYPELAKNEGDWLDKQLVYINHQQADGDFNVAEYYRRVGKPGSAYFYYELVRRRYQETEYSQLAVARMDEIRAKAEKEQVAQRKIDDDLRNAPPRQQQDLLSRLFPWRRQSQPQPQPTPQSQEIVPVSMPGEPVR